MFKVISAETKKIVSKPGIYILSVLLAILLVLGVFIYKPVAYKSSQFELKGQTFVEKYTEFKGGSNYGKKAEINALLDKSINAVNNYRITANSKQYSQKEYINYLLEQFNTNFNKYHDGASDNSTQTSIDKNRDNLVNSLKAIHNEIEKSIIINSHHNSYSLLTTTSNYKSYKSAYKKLLDWANTTVKKANLKTHFDGLANKKDAWNQTISNFKYPTLSNEIIHSYTVNTEGTNLYILNTRIADIESQIEENLITAKNDEYFNDHSAYVMDDLANLYVNTIDTYVNLVKYELISNAFDAVSTAEQKNILNLSEYSSYNSKSLLVKYEYLFNNNETSVIYSNPLTIGVTSNKSINAYDYSYFILRIFSFVIIIYAIMSACHSIAGEIKEGTMRYFAIRPMSRVNMFLGKWFAILIMSFILTIFSAIISLCVGGAVYGFSTQTILTIFNGQIALTMHPLVMIGIYLLSMFLELVVYTIVAMLLSTIFKSDLMCMTILFVVYIVNTILPIFVQGTNSWLTFYPFSHISIYALFGSSIYAVPNNIFNLIFGAKVYAGTNIILTICIIALIITSAIIASIKLFKKKEL